MGVVCPPRNFATEPVAARCARDCHHERSEAISIILRSPHGIYQHALIKAPGRNQPVHQRQRPPADPSPELICPARPRCDLPDSDHLDNRAPGADFCSSVGLPQVLTSCAPGAAVTASIQMRLRYDPGGIFSSTTVIIFGRFNIHDRLNLIVTLPLGRFPIIANRFVTDIRSFRKSWESSALNLQLAMIGNRHLKTRKASGRTLRVGLVHRRNDIIEQMLRQRTKLQPVAAQCAPAPPPLDLRIASEVTSASSRAAPIR